MASTEGVVSIASNINHRVAVCLNHQTTHGFTKVADAMVRLNSSVVHIVLTLSDGDRPWSGPVTAPASLAVS